MSSRTQILQRVRTALAKPSRRPHPAPAGEVFPEIKTSDLLARFTQEFLALKGEIHCAPDWAAAQAWTKLIVEKNEFHRVSAAPHADAIQASQLVQPTILTGDGDCGKNLANSNLGISLCDCLVARTGSVVLTSQSGFGRSLSVLPPAHLVVARRTQIVTNLSDAYQLLKERYMPTWPSMMTIISGPSRTSDIEKMLVLGAHGPKKLFVLILDF